MVTSATAIIKLTSYTHSNIPVTDGDVMSTVTWDILRP